MRAIQSTPLFAKSGKPIGMLSIHYKAPHRPDARSLRRLDRIARQAVDVIERARAEQALRESEEKYAAIFHMSPFAIALTRMPEGVTVDVNDAFLKLFEHAREDVIGKTSVDLGISDSDSRDRLRAELAARRSVRDFECVRMTKSGSQRILSLSLNWVTIGGERHVLTQAVDITERKESESRHRSLTEQLLDLNRDLEQRVSERTEELRRERAVAESASAAKSAFLASMSHELRTPLNSILGFAQLLERDRRRPLDERQREHLGHLLRAGEHLVRLIDDLLDLSKIEAGRLTISLGSVSIREVLDEVVDTLASMAERADITIVPIELVELPHVTADRTRLAQILMNFGSNAIKYGKRGGHVKFVLERRDPAAVRIGVIDDGIGIPSEQREKLFEPFQRAGQETGLIEGTGMGLAITKRLAEMMKARVGFTSDVERGSEFWIELLIARL